jgi:protein TonB
VSASSAPRLTGGVIASVVFHAALITAFFLAGPGKTPPAPPIYSVRLFAAPAAEPGIGVVQPPPVAAPAPTPPPVAKPATPRPKVPATKPKPTPVPPVATQTPVAKPAEPTKTAAPAPTAGSATGGRGADVANAVTPGLEFPYPAYTNNIANSLLKYFGQPDTRLVAEVQFIIRRDGSVGSIQIVTSSRNYTFDQRARGAVEAAANAKAFGPLPDGFNEDILPIRFRFSPSLTSR